MPTEDEIESQLNELTSRLAEESVGAVDPGINAKAIAVSSSDVRARIADALSAENRLRRITALSGYGTPMDCRVRFEFESARDLVPLSTADFVVSVELPTKAVRKILPPGESLDVSGVAAPFSIAVPSAAREIRTPISEVEARRAQARRFLRARIPNFLQPRAPSVPPGQGHRVTAHFGDYESTYYDTPHSTSETTYSDTTTSTTTISDGYSDDSQGDTDYDTSTDVLNDYTLDVTDDALV